MRLKSACSAWPRPQVGEMGGKKSCARPKARAFHRRGGAGGDGGVPQQTVSMVNNDIAFAGTTLFFGAAALCISTNWLCFSSIRRTGFVVRASVSSPTTDALAVRPGAEPFRSLRDHAGTERANRNGGILIPMGTNPRHQRPSGRIAGGRPRAVTLTFVPPHNGADPSPLRCRSQPCSPLNSQTIFNVHSREGRSHDARRPKLRVGSRPPAAAAAGGGA